MLWTALFTIPQLERQPLRPVLVLERGSLPGEQQLARQRLGRSEPCGGFRKSLHFSLDLVSGEFCFKSCDIICPCQPPSILPISSIRTERVIYFLLSIDFVSHKTISSIFIVSTFLVANLIQGVFSFLLKKVATDTASIVSTNKLSIFWPKEFL